MKSEITLLPHVGSGKLLKIISNICLPFKLSNNIATFLPVASCCYSHTVHKLNCLHTMKKNTKLQKYSIQNTVQISCTACNTRWSFIKMSFQEEQCHTFRDNGKVSWFCLHVFCRRHTTMLLWICWASVGICWVWITANRSWYIQIESLQHWQTRTSILEDFTKHWFTFNVFFVFFWFNAKVFEPNVSVLFFNSWKDTLVT